MNSETIGIKINEHEEKLDKHDCRIINLEKDTTKQDTQITQLCASLKTLTDMIEKKLDKTGDYKWIIASILMPIIFFLCSKIMG
ncbi:hemolysin XhlA family protein [Clostridium tagluense]|uniref:hemolysin XhlA family protein n=1 Tax=Clostridium tagluense TaxID=360422 RepID=UPI001C6EAA36|nr:hemolysin XhlA family protein [Clostridium tagluense]MBW9156283.1 hemolysin XhlA family protein [Clostridium tagluense]WLC64301.1 hemolysin XhlA family protein [Clostridium tagluense]